MKGLLTRCCTLNRAALDYPAEKVISKDSYSKKYSKKDTSSPGAMDLSLSQPEEVASQPVAALKTANRGWVIRESGRVPGIDVLRGLCIIAVVLHHINIRIHFRDSGLGHLIGPAAIRVLFWSGYYGVRVFFVISGFLITTWSLKRWGSLAQMDRRQFYLMRFARIMPCLLGLLVVLSILDRAGVPKFTINTQHTS